MFNHKISQQIANLVIILLCISVTVFGFGTVQKIQNIKTTLPITVEQTWREQARRTLSNTRDEFLADIKNGEVDPLDDKSVQKWASIYYTGLRNGGKTSDGFIIRMPKGKFIWDGSPDCATLDLSTAGRFIANEPPNHKVPADAIKTYGEMRKMYSTKAGDDNYWNYDDSTEYLEWIVVPNDSYGIGMEPLTDGGVVNPKYTSFIFALGTQDDEIMKPYADIISNTDITIQNTKLIVIIIITFSLFNLTAYVFLVKKNKQ